MKRRFSAIAVAIALGAVVGSTLSIWIDSRTAAPSSTTIDLAGAVRAAGVEVGGVRLTASSPSAPAVLEVSFSNRGSADLVGVGYVLLDDARVAAYEERAVLRPGEQEHRRLRWYPSGAAVHRLSLTIGDGNVHFLRHEFHATVIDDGAGRTLRPSSIVLAAAAIAGAAIAGAAAWIIGSRIGDSFVRDEHV